MRSCRNCGDPYEIVNGIWQCRRCNEKQQYRKPIHRAMMRLIEDPRVEHKVKVKEFEKLDKALDKLQRLEND